MEKVLLYAKSIGGKENWGKYLSAAIQKNTSTDIIRSCVSNEIKLNTSCDVELKVMCREFKTITFLISWRRLFMTKRRRKHLNQLTKLHDSADLVVRWSLSSEQNVENRRKHVQELLEHLSFLKLSVACPCSNITAVFFIFCKKVWIFFFLSVTLTRS